jgi:hypothetical protein
MALEWGVALTSAGLRGDVLMLKVGVRQTHQQRPLAAVGQMRGERKALLFR